MLNLCIFRLKTMKKHGVFNISAKNRPKIMCFSICQPDIIKRVVSCNAKAMCFSIKKYTPRSPDCNCGDMVAEFIEKRWVFEHLPPTTLKNIEFFSMCGLTRGPPGRRKLGVITSTSRRWEEIALTLKSLKSVGFLKLVARNC